MKLSQIRQNRITKQWVIYSPARKKRPKDFEMESKKSVLPSHDKNCPFCRGNEHMLPPVIMEMGQASGEWMTRVIPNKFPALTPEGSMKRVTRGIYLEIQGYGHHEVVIETPHHDRQPGIMSTEEMGSVIETYHRRYVDLLKKDENMMIIIFRNHGRKAGTSLVHPHSQIIATGMVPHHIRWREEEAQHYYDEWGRCIFCDMLAYELKHGKRIITENEFFAAFVPYAAEVAFEVWIMPKEHKADFGDIMDREKTDLASIMRNILGKYHKRLGDPDYNYVINTSVRYRANEPQLHWYLQLLPRLMTRAGFEIGSGININPSIPEDDVQFLRDSPC
ncbi:MAG: galactose-1-phosphate uridylyltransferase [Nitrospirota bacterium]